MPVTKLATWCGERPKSPQAKEPSGQRALSRVRKNFAVIPGRPLGPGPESKNTGQTIDFISPCSWIPGSRAKPAPRNDHPSAFFPQRAHGPPQILPGASPQVVHAAAHRRR
jgi:hypothetical protein